MGHRPYPNRERAARQIDRRYLTREERRVIEGQAPGAEGAFVGEYRLSSRGYVSRGRHSEQ
ncbi:hypothetical protein KBY55_09505 [Streptomyces sp. b94]|uniref:hypothetical protein n=1 Tax=Streptomyces sp. b94 TaxID=1827634 RepID=UPI001B367F48|nr:hypothetical protein [Streptomyces sp. b94]MBQ1096319.1 hypothetical protein [Streptomyces sp. b94]